jgi:nucleotide-binding universal stress UspA family protein
MKGMVAMYNKVLVPTDGSKGAAAAIEFARDLLIGGVVQAVTLVYIASISREVSNFSIINTKRIDEEMVKSKLIHQGQQVLAHSKVPFEQNGLSIDILVELSDDPAERIIKIAHEQNFDLIVMGSRGLSVMKELILGSVSSEVLHNAGCPVIIYKG